MDIDKYFKILKQIPPIFYNHNTLWNNIITNAIYQNHWLTNDFLNLKTQLICNTFFTEKNLSVLKEYLLNNKFIKNKKTALIIQDNIILSGIYNLIIEFGLGRDIEIKCLPHHKTLLEPIVDILNSIEKRIFFVEKTTPCNFYMLHRKEKLSPTAVFYFKKYPYIIYSPKKGLVLIEGNEPKEKLKLLAKHIFSFFGMENLNICKILIPKNYDVNLLFEHFKTYNYFKNHTPYATQYDYHLATIILQKKHYFTNGLITIFENTELFSPISTLSFEYYDKMPNLSSLNNENISYIIKANDLEENTMELLEAQNFLFLNHL